jgi:hypothetical protein
VANDRSPSTPEPVAVLGAQMLDQLVEPLAEARAGEVVPADCSACHEPRTVHGCVTGH